MAQKRQYASLTSLFAQLFIELAEWHSPLYLVIDDYHLITNPVIHESMRFFIRHQPENLTLVVLSRNLPQLALPICVFVTSCWKLAVSNWHLPIRKRNSFLIAVCHRRLKLQKAVGFVMMFPVGRRHCS